MTKSDQTELERLKAVLERAAEELTDLSPCAMSLFYRRHPDARSAFEHHGAGKRDQLEAEMVDNALYFLMTWMERRCEISIMLKGSVPHHDHTLKVEPEWYRGLLESVIDVIAATVPADDVDGTAIIEEIRGGLLDVIDEAAAGS